MADSDSVPLSTASSSSSPPSRSSWYYYVFGGCGLTALFGGAAWGFYSGQKHADQMAKEAAAAREQLIKAGKLPKQSKPIEVTPEMRRLAIRRALSAFGFGTLLCLTSAGIAVYTARNYYGLKSMEEIKRTASEQLVVPVSQWSSSIGLQAFTRDSQQTFQSSAVGQWVHSYFKLNDELWNKELTKEENEKITELLGNDELQQNNKQEEGKR
jgi:hypothetical protein